MRIHSLGKVLFAAALAAPLVAHAEVGIYAKAGTLGFGGGVGFGLTDSISARVGYTAYDFDKDISDTDVNYEGEFKLGGAEALLDWHPFNGSFRLTGGVVFSRNKIDVQAKLNQQVTINDVEYDAGDVGDLSGDIKFKSTVPYLGIGWGNVAGKDGNFHFVADIGVEYLGNPKVSLHGSCTPAFAASNPAECADLSDDIAQEEENLNDEASDYKWWPVVSIGVAYRF